MEFILTFNQPLDVYETNADPVKGKVPLEAWRLYMNAMGSAGILRGAKRLEARAGTSVKVREGRRQVQDGPYLETKELLGGFAIIDVSSLDEALQWAERSPSSAVGSTQVFPVIPIPTGGN